MENAAEETFRNQDTKKVGRYAAKSNYSPVIHWPFFASRFMSSVPTALR